MRLALALLLALGFAFEVAAADPKPIKVAVGDEFEILLASPAGANRQWLLSKPLDETLLKQCGREYRNRPAKNSGRETCELLRYKALARGQTEIHLKFATVFEKNDGLQKTNFVVIITPAAAK